jgi:hypothetical protein
MTNSCSRLWFSALYVKLIDHQNFHSRPIRDVPAVWNRGRENVTSPMSTDLNSDGGWLRRLIEVMDAIDSHCNGPSAAKRATQGLLDRLRLPADRMSDHASTGS